MSDKAKMNLEEEFIAVHDKMLDELKKHLKDAEDSLDKAVALSEMNGIPFYSNISFLSNSYVPTSLKEKFKGLSTSTVEEVTGVWEDYPGWHHSQIC
jgi:hypothetical protein